MAADGRDCCHALRDSPKRKLLTIQTKPREHFAFTEWRNPSRVCAVVTAKRE